MHQRLKTATTQIQIEYLTNAYIPEKGMTKGWNILKIKVGEGVTTNCFYCEWRNAFGQMAIEREANNIKQSARLRIAFNKKLYETLLNKQVRIIKHESNNTPRVYELISTPDNYMQQNKFLEFEVKRSDSK